MPDVLEALDDLVESVSLFELEDPTSGATTGWRIDLFARRRPDPAALTRALAPLVGKKRAARLELAPVPATDWLLAAAMQIEPVRAGRFFVHGAKDRQRAPADAVPIELEAGLAFGSGEHATTRACLLAIDRLARRRPFRRVLDLGCGSGILGIAAAKCWPCRVVAADIDEVAVRVAAENAAGNGVASRVAAVVSDGYRHPAIRRGAPFDLIVANILANPLIELAPRSARHLAPGGHAILSGLLDRQADAVVAAHRRAGLRPRGLLREGPWVALLLRGPRRP